jgi:hypothetical protein
MGFEVGKSVLLRENGAGPVLQGKVASMHYGNCNSVLITFTCMANQSPLPPLAGANLRKYDMAPGSSERDLFVTDGGHVVLGWDADLLSKTAELLGLTGGRRRRQTGASSSRGGAARLKLAAIMVKCSPSRALTTAHRHSVEGTHFKQHTQALTGLQRTGSQD